MQCFYHCIWSLSQLVSCIVIAHLRVCLDVTFDQAALKRMGLIETGGFHRNQRSSPFETKLKFRLVFVPHLRQNSSTRKKFRKLSNLSQNVHYFILFSGGFRVLYVTQHFKRKLCIQKDNGKKLRVCKGSNSIQYLPSTLSINITVTCLAYFLQEIDGSLRFLFVYSGGESVHKIQPMFSSFTKLTDFIFNFQKVSFYIHKIWNNYL